jgi:surface antigen
MNYMVGGDIMKYVSAFANLATTLTLGDFGADLCQILQSKAGKITMIAGGIALFAVAVAATVPSGGTSLAGYISAITSVAGSALTVGTALSIAAQVGIPILLRYVGPQLARIVAGKIIGTDIAGEDFGNAIMIGAGTLYAKSAGTSGNLALGKKEAVAMYGEYQNYIAEVAEDERLARSPFDATSKYTFMGSIASSLMSQMGSLKSVSGILTSVGSMASTAISHLAPTASALDMASFKNGLDTCDDPDYNDFGIATDPFCNPIMGVPVSALDADPEEVLQYLDDEKQITIDADGTTEIIPCIDHSTKECKDNPEKDGDKTDLELYKEYCVDRTTALTLSEEDNADKVKKGYNCVTRDGDSDAVKKQKSYFALYFLDDRIENDVDGEGMDRAAGVSDADDETIADSGLTYEQAKQLVMNYGKNKDDDSTKNMNKGPGKPGTGCNGGALSNCVSFSAFFMNKFTDARYQGGNGENVVSRLKASGVPTGKTPKVGAIFSWSNSGAGHTGVVLGINGDNVIVGHAGCSNPGKGEGNGIKSGGGAGFVIQGSKTSTKPWFGKVPTEFAYPKTINWDEVAKYVSN